MKIIGVIPARYASTRFPGKPLTNINIKPIFEEGKQC
ncbi:cytidylyltransferase domain-containing protein [Treponema endosymbiont of Eucomonympha sp.]